jgi:hypothetical protein
MNLHPTSILRVQAPRGSCARARRIGSTPARAFEVTEIKPLLMRAIDQGCGARRAGRRIRHLPVRQKFDARTPIEIDVRRCTPCPSQAAAVWK